MKGPLLTFLVSLLTISSFCQEIEFCSSLNTSSEKRFQDATGIGIQYQHDVGSRFKTGFGVHYSFNNIRFDDIPYVDGDPNLLIADRINSSSKRVSFRINIQRLFANTENLSFSLGPEISYNYLWGQDQIDESQGQTSNRFYLLQKNGLTKEIGLGLISKLEIKKFIFPKFSFCISVRPEFITGGVFTKGGNQVFSGVLGFTEFQIGLKYRFKL